MCASAGSVLTMPIINQPQVAILGVGAPGRPLRAEVIDFKTDRVDAAGVGERAAFYAAQLESYRRVLARMTGLRLEAIEGLLAFVELGTVGRLDTLKQPS